MKLRKVKRLLSKLLVCCIVLALMPMLSPWVQAATYSLTDTNIGVSGDSGWTVSGTAISRSIDGDTGSSAITITNNSGSTAVLSFEYSGHLKSGNGSNTASATGVKTATSGTQTTVFTHSQASDSAWKTSKESDYSSSGTKTVELEAGEKVTITLKGGQESGWGKTEGSASIEIISINLKIKTTANVTFAPDSAVSYTVGYVDGNGASQSASVTAGDSNVTVEAELSEGMTITPTTEGYTCESAAGSVSGMVYADSNSKFTFTKEETVTPVFLSSGATRPFTHLGLNKSYADLNAATNAGAGTVVLNQDYTLPAGNYTIPYGVTLLIPCDDANTVYTTEPGKEASDTYHETSEYRKLTMANGAKITVGGAISLGGKIGNNMTGEVAKYYYTNGAPSGPLGYIDMAGGSSITVSSGGNLYAWGFVTGSGSVTVKNGGTVYEDLQIRDWRGGNCTVSVHDKRGTYRAFPFNQYYIQNIEVPLTMEAGATENVCVAMSITLVGVVVQENATFIGRNSGLIQMSSGSLTRTYDGSKDRIIYDLNGNISLANLNISIRTSITGTITINSSEYVMPITSNMTLNANKGSAVTVAQDFALLPGAEVNIMNGATVTLSKDKRIYVYDATEWGNYSGAGNTKLSPVFYAPSKAYTRTASDLTDGKVVVNGTLDASASYLYSTVSGGNIISDGGGVVKTAKGTETVTYQISQSGKTPSFPEISITPVMLKHGDGTYAITANSTTNPNTYTYTDGKWVCTTHTEEETIQTPAACETAGVKTVTCKVCGTTRTEEIPALTHKDENPKDHSCDNNCGKSDMGTHADGDDNNHTCDYCNGAVEGDVCVDANSDHKCDECGTSVSDCVDEGKDHKCDICGKNVGIHEAAQGTHICAYCNQKASDCDYTVRGDIVREANCVTKAVYKAKCSVCGAVSETETITGEVDSSKHTGKTDVRNAKPATCAAEGYTGDTHCFDCGVKLRDGTTTEKLTTHTYPETWTQTKAPTCTEKGSEERKCTVEGCDATETRDVEEQGHNWATTLTRGETTHWYGCSRCDAKNGEATHSYDWEVTKEATCYQDGSKSGTCSCGATATEVIDATGKHTYSETYTTENGSHWRACTTTGCTKKTDEGICSGGAATCTTPATCSVCGQSYGTVDENAHNWGNWEVTTPASCTAEGEEVRTCSYDSAHTETQAIKKAAHTMTHHVRVEATCVAAGNVEYWNCSGCGLNYSDENGTTKLDAVDIAINSDAHDLKNVAAQSATCIQIGWDAYQKCQREGCNYSTYVEIPKLNHTDADNDGDHLCDTDGCSEVVTTCEDTGKDHICDSDSACNIYSTGNNAHVDSDNDHECDYGCNVSIGECKDGDDADHKCDYGCGKDNLTDHNYGTEWKTDDTNHWHECACGEKSDLANHSYDEGVVTKEPTTEAAGEKTYTCECGYSYIETIDKLVPQGYTVNIVNYTANDANLATVTIGGHAVEYQKKTAVEATLGTDGILTVSCARACVVAYTTNDLDYTEVYAVANDNGSYSFTIDTPVEGMTIAVVHNGDLNLSGAVDSTDVARLQRYCAGMTSKNAQITVLGMLVADVNLKDGVNSTDVARIQRNTAGMTSKNAIISWHQK